MKQITKIFLLILLAMLLVLQVSADETPYILDDAGLLTISQQTELNGMAQDITDTYGCAVYIATVEDLREYGYYDVYDFTWNVYHQMKLGCGPEREGMILLLSMADRDFATFFYGDDTEYAFNSYGQEKLEDYFLGDLSRNDWYGGFRGYLDGVEHFLARADAGRPVRKSALGLSLLFILAACVVSGIITGTMWAMMNNVRPQSGASHYAVANSLHLTRQSEKLVHRSQSRRRINRSGSGSSSRSGSGSRSRSGGGGSGRSGKF